MSQRPARPTLASLLDQPCDQFAGPRKIVESIDVVSHVATLRCTDCGAHVYRHYAPGEPMPR